MDKKEAFYLIKFGDLLRKHRRSQKISQQQLGFETGLTRESINRIENGKINISLLNIIKIAKALSIPPKDLFDIE